MNGLFDKYNKVQLNNLLALQKNVGLRYNDLASKLSAIAQRYDPRFRISGVWAGPNARIKKEIEKLLKQFSESLDAMIRKFIENSWTLAENKNDDLVMKVLKSSSALVGGAGVYKLLNRLAPKKNPLVFLPKAMKLGDTPEKISAQFELLFLGKKYSSDGVLIDEVLSSPRNQEAYQRFINRKVKGLDLSKRVWKITEENKNMMEELLGNGILEGKGAPQTAKIIREYLQQPDKFFRRVRNKETGELELSSNAISYNPGRGIYRSSQQNALRLALNETNMAYRKADHERWKENGFIIGYEVSTSGSHPTADMCDSLAGKYPKDFIWTGWHVRCMCKAVPIQLSQKDYDKYEDAILEGREDEYLSGVKQISTVPSGFKQWIQDNAERSKGWKSQPYFIQDNFIDGDIEKGLLIDAKIVV